MAEFYFDEIIQIHRVDNQVVYDKGNENLASLALELALPLALCAFSFDGVSRIIAKSEDGEFYLELDVNKELYPMLPGEKYRMVMANTLLMDGSAVSGYFPERKQKSLADKFEYVMHGLLYKMSEVQVKTDDAGTDTKLAVFVSFGGLQLLLRSDPLKLHKFKVDQRLFLLLLKM
ncbi:DNA-directed RNA polymerase II, IV and V subunit 8B-like [Dorcoceras hygrometricum]|uniref:DNA-directed RNA polymerase II, IV and V subunit 8B-like n=1 Tax=Dorcoceras hygrometricum TaxID=472368 RepID=A0A2Z7AZM4_9LAMI|nr:DNA-directed RNA polymerase II, IV and V subunit 8B-like [Dorcoceras hygrometricum]